MITLTSNDDVSFSVYGKALVRDSKRFQLQQKYQELDNTVIASSDGTILSYYVDFVNGDDVVLLKKNYEDLLSLADYMQSVRFEHEVKWQLLYKDIMRRYMKLSREDNGNDKGVISNIISADDVHDNPDMILRTLSSHRN